MTLVATLASLALSLQPFAPSQQQDFGKTWSTVESAIRTRFYARISRKDEIDKLLSDAKPKATAAKTEAEFSKAVNDMIDAFKDSHFDFFTKEDQGFYVMAALLRGANAPKMPNIDAWFKPATDGYTVQMLLNGGSCEKAGIRKGDVIVRIDGQPFTPVSSLRSRVDKDAKLTVRRGSQTFEATVAVDEEIGADMFLQASKRSTRVIESGGKKIGYFHLWTQANDDFRNALSSAVYGPLRETDAMVLDLRDGFGGRPEGFADPFFRPEVQLEWKFGENAPGMKQLFGYQRPLVVLINEGSRSAKEVLSLILKSCGRATLIGSTTAGHVLGTSPMPVEDWGYLEIPMVDLITDGERLEGKGVAPHIPLPREMDENGNDLHLQRALEFLGDKLKTTSG